jgi:ribosomal protein S18 acetylase RimI-like enzyme
MLKTSETRIRRAQPKDAPGIYELKVEAFGSTALPYTIYQDPRSVRFISRTIEKGSGITANYFFVAGRERLKGYYHAVSLGETFFLNYIAVRDTEQGLGLGDRLLDHFEETARALGRKTLSLDVFRSHEAVLSWYHRRGFRAQSSSYHLLVRLDDLLAMEGTLMEFRLLDEFRARWRERRFGFSKIEGLIGEKLVTVGLIGERVCKLLSADDDLDSIAASIARTFRSDRERLIVSGLRTLPESWALSRWDRTLRMEKELIDEQNLDALEVREDRMQTVPV